MGTFDNLKSRWEIMDPKSKRYFYLGGLVGIGVLIALAMPEKEVRERSERVEKPDRSVLARGSDDADIGNVNAKVDSLTKLLSETQKELGELKKDASARLAITSKMSDLSKDPEALAGLIAEMNDLNLRLDEMEAQGATKLNSNVDIIVGSDEFDPSVTQGFDDPLDTSSVNDIDDFDPAKDLKGVLNTSGKKKATRNQEKSPGFSFADESTVSTHQYPKIRLPASLSEDEETNTESRTAVNQNNRSTRDNRSRVSAEAKKQKGIYLPPTTQFSAVLLNGMDAPAHNGSSDEPYPVVLRVSGLGFMPNNYETNIDDCRILASGFGNISTERVKIRTERLVCLLENETVIDVELKGYITGPDGKVGIRGVLVQRSGALLARAAVAGFGAGISEATQPQVVRGVSTGSDGGVLRFDRPETSEVLEVGAYEGISNSLESLGKYYLEQAEQIFPVIEIEPLVQVAVHVTEGTNIHILDGEKWGDSIDLARY